MPDTELPGWSRIPDDLQLENRQIFVLQIPELINRLRMRRPAAAFALNLSEASLQALDREIAAVISVLPGGYSKIAETIDRELLRQVAAYVGEVIVRNCNGKWQTNPIENATGPEVVFPIGQEPGMTPSRWKVIDVYEQVLVTILEGDTFAGWYASEVQDDNKA